MHEQLTKSSLNVWRTFLYQSHFIISQKMYVISLVLWTIVSHPLVILFPCVPCQDVCWTWGLCPELLQLTCCMSGRSPAANRVHRTSTNANWTSTRQTVFEFQTKRMPAYSYRTSSQHLFPVESIPSFVHVQNFLPDWPDLAWQGAHSLYEKQTRNACGRRLTDWKSCSPLDTVNAIRKVWQTLEKYYSEIK